MKTIAENLKSILKLRNKTTYQLAKDLDSYQSTVAMWCNGSREPSAYSIIRICNALKCSSDELLGLKEIKNDGRGEDSDCDSETN